MYAFTKIFISIWLTGITTFGIMSAINNSRKEEIWLFIMPTVMLLFGMALLHIGWLIGRKDMVYIDTEIKKTISSKNKTFEPAIEK